MGLGEAASGVSAFLQEPHPRVGLSKVTGLWGLPELCFSIPVRREAQEGMAQSGVADGRSMSSQGWEYLPPK